MRLIAAKFWGALPLGLLLVAHLAFAILLALWSLLDASAFIAAFHHPQVRGGILLTVATGVASTALSLLLAVWIVARNRLDHLRSTAAMLALPHLAFAIGLAFVLVPTGLIARLLAMVLGWDVPPQWITAQDPHGMALVAALVLKETPFLVWALVSHLQREDVAAALSGQIAVAHSLGHGSRSIWLRVVLPQVLPRILWPLVAVLSYGMTVVDVALVIGPTQPPPLAVVIWRDLNDAEVAMNARGAAGVAVLALAVGAVIACAVLALKLLRPATFKFLTAGPSPGRSHTMHLPAQRRGGGVWFLFKLAYVLVFLILVAQSVAGPWPFPQLLPETLNLRAWAVRLLTEPQPYLNTLAYSLVSSVVAVVASVTWFESQSVQRDRLVIAAAVATLTLPALVIALGQYRMVLILGLTGTRLAVFLAHLLPVIAYVLIMLQGPYRGFDQRWQAVAAGLSVSRWQFLAFVKWPLLKGPLLSAAAVGFAVGVAQFVSVQLAAAGRHTTLATETITLSSGGNRNMIAVSALAMMVLPLAVFAVARHFGQPRWSR